MKKWQNVLPVTVIIVIIGLAFAAYWFSPANQAQLAYTMREPEPTLSNNEYATRVAIEFNLTPNPVPKTFYLDEGVHTLYIVGREAGELDKVQIVPASDIYAELTATAMAWTPTVTETPAPATVTPIYTATLPVLDYEIVAVDVWVKIYYLGPPGSSGLIGGLNERPEHSLYNFSDGYRLPYCDFVPKPVDYRQCSRNQTHLLYVIKVINGLPYDIGYWGAINEDVWIALYIQKHDKWYSDWRPE